ncbi:MAG: hypothetical protein EOO38_24130, partial [Cytophagaceae bacterium]
MISQLTLNERQVALCILVVIGIAGLALGLTGRDDLLGLHGGLVLVAALIGIFIVIESYYSPEPSDERLNEYYDVPSKIGIILSMGWAVVGLSFGLWVAALLAWPDLTFDAGWASFGRIRRSNPEVANREPSAQTTLVTLATIAAWICVVVSLIAALQGYVNFALFLSRQTIWTAVVGASTYLLL